MERDISPGRASITSVCEYTVSAGHSFSLQVEVFPPTADRQTSEGSVSDKDISVNQDNQTFAAADQVQTVESLADEMEEEHITMARFGPSSKVFLQSRGLEEMVT